MKTVTLILFIAMLAAADDQAKKNAPPPEPASSQDASKSIPAGAVQVAPGVYRYTDDKGKTWMYTRTPFGLSKTEDKPPARAAAVDDSYGLVTTDLGDSVQFERKTPFGITKSVKKKSELTDYEKELLSHAKERQAAGEKASQAKPQTPDKASEKK